MTKQWITDTEPDPSMPVFTRLNAADVMSAPVTPLGASLCWLPSILPGWKTGYLTQHSFWPSELEHESAVVGYFYGHLYVNQTSVRIVGIRQGIGWEAIDMAFFNSPGAPAHEPRDSDTDPELTALMGEFTGWVLSTTEFPALDEDREIADWYRANRPDLKRASNLALVAHARSLMPIERLMWRGEVVGSSSSGIGPGLAAMILGPEKAHLLTTILGHAGDVDSALPSYALWDLSRKVRASAEMMAAFDGGVEGVLDRATDEFRADFAGFIKDFGYRGPSEWDLGQDSWETKPSLALALIERLRHLDEEASPRNKPESQEADRSAAMAQALEGLDEQNAGLLQAAVSSARRFGAWRERGKTNSIKIINEARVTLVELGNRLAAEGRISHPRQIFIALDEELDALAVGKGEWIDILNEREAAWKDLFNVQVPTFIDGRNPLVPLAELPRKGTGEVRSLVPGDVLNGAAASTGTVEGIARIVLDTDSISEFEPGEILVAPQTDPSWTPLFMVAGAVVVDTGSMGSHAMIVARELGIPCVAGLPGATTSIPDGATIRVDGAAGTVTIVALP